jgi:hypothetical protein
MRLLGAEKLDKFTLSGYLIYVFDLASQIIFVKFNKLLPLMWQPHNMVIGYRRNELRFKSIIR